VTFFEQVNGQVECIAVRNVSKQGQVESVVKHLCSVVGRDLCVIPDQLITKQGVVGRIVLDAVET